MLKLNFHYFGHLVWTANSLGKPQMLGKTEGRRRRGHPSEDEMFGWHHSAMARTWENFGRWRVTGKLDVLRSRRVGHDWASTAPTSATAPRTSLFYLHWCAPPSLYWLLRNVSPSTHACCVLRAACCVLRPASCVMSDAWWPSGLWSARILCLWGFPGKKSTGVGCHFLAQGILLTRGSNLQSLVSPAPAAGFFTTSDTSEAPIFLWWKCNSCIIPILHDLKASNVCN